MNKKGELVDWTIVLNSLNKEDDDRKHEIGDQLIYKPRRTIRDVGKPDTLDFYTVKAISDPTDFREIFDPSSSEYEKVDHYDSSKDYKEFTSKNGLMSIYVMDLFEKIEDHYDPNTNKMVTKRGPIINDGINVCAPAIWFSKTKDYEASATIYYVNEDYLSKEQKQNESDLLEFGEEEE